MFCLMQMNNKHPTSASIELSETFISTFAFPSIIEISPIVFGCTHNYISQKCLNNAY